MIKDTMTVGDILQIVSFLIAAFAVYNRLSNKITKIETKLDLIYEWWTNRARIYEGKDGCD